MNSNILTGGSFELEWLIFKSNEWKAKVRVGHPVTGMLRSVLLLVTCHPGIFKFHFCK